MAFKYPKNRLNLRKKLFQLLQKQHLDIIAGRRPVEAACETVDNVIKIIANNYRRRKYDRT